MTMAQAPLISICREPVAQQAVRQAVPLIHMLRRCGFVVDFRLFGVDLNFLMVIHLAVDLV